MLCGSLQQGPTTKSGKAGVHAMTDKVQSKLDLGCMHNV